jgi:hypothetical protein
MKPTSNHPCDDWVKLGINTANGFMQPLYQSRQWKAMNSVGVALVW